MRLRRLVAWALIVLGFGCGPSGASRRPNGFAGTLDAPPRHLPAEPALDLSTQEGRYKTGLRAPLAVLLDLERSTASGANASDRMLRDERAQWHARLGEFATAVEVFDSVAPRQQRDVASMPETARAVDAVEGIVARAAQHRIVLVNEAHHVPEHRAFTVELLRALRPLGFSYFAAETLFDGDDDLAKRGYARVGRTGYFTDEPVGGELVREALRLGYEVVPYEAADEPCDGSQCVDSREQGEARNLEERILRRDPGAKVVVHAGFGHIREDATSYGFRSMAYLLKRSTGLDPLSVDQVSLMPRASGALESPLRASALARFRPQRPIFIESATGLLRSVNAREMDLTVLHPETRLLNGRPSWMRDLPGRRPWPIPSRACGGQVPCLVVASRPGEAPDATPTDQVVIRDETRTTDLYVAASGASVTALTPGGRVLRTWQVR